ncbi:MAG: hypothetical protein ABL961_11965 [Vicinamibacterales bacterium]
MTNTTPFAESAKSVTSEPAALSPDRAFVVHFYAAAAGAEIEAGRAEHVRSGQTTHFRSWAELAAFVAATVGAQRRS